MKRETYYWLFLWLFLGLTICALLAAAEYSLRLAFPEKRTIYMPNPQTVASFLPNLDRNRAIWGNTVVNLLTNDYGIRDDSNTGPDEADIWIFGDSNIAALFMPFEDTLGEQLERLYDHNIQAVNFGVPGYGPDQSLRRFLSESRQATPKAVIFHIFADNDLGDLFRNNIFRFDGDNIIVRQDLERDPIFQTERYFLLKGLQRFGISPHFNTPKGYYPQSHRGKELPSNNPGELESWVKTSADEYENYLAGMWTSWNGDHYDYEIAAHPNGEMARNAARLLTYVLDRAKQAYTGRSECFVILIQPSEFDIGGDSPINREIFKALYPDYSPATLAGIAIDASETAGLPYIDLREAYSDTPAEYYFRQAVAGPDNHWNANGIAKAASYIKSYLDAHDCVR